jgi:hypothetical protein
VALHYVFFARADLIILFFNPVCVSAFGCFVWFVCLSLDALHGLCVGLMLMYCVFVDGTVLALLSLCMCVCRLVFIC